MTKGLQESYISYDKKERECLICRDILPFNKFSTTKYGKPISWCKKCKSRRTYRIKREGKLERYPSLYVECENEDCGHIFHIRFEKCIKCDKEIK